MLSSMKSPSPLLLLLVLLPPLAGAQLPPPGAGDGNPYPYARFSPTMAIIIVVLIAALFLMGFFSIYIRHCSDPSTSGATARRVLSTRRRAAAAPGLDQSVLETFPIFTYSDVKSHKIGKGALECAVCLNEFEDDETLRLIPKCDHVFHPECIDAWLESHVTCPVCRTNLVPQPGDALTPEPVQAPEPPENNTIERNRSRTGEVVIEIDENRKRTEPVDPVEYPNRAPRSWSVRTARVFGLNKFRSHSTGHSLVQPGENLDRFTLRLPKEMMERAVLNRTASCAVTLPRERSSRRGIRTGDGSSRGGRFFQRIERSDQEGKSDRWIFFSRGLSTRSTKVVADAGESSGGSGRPVKLPSFNCLEPKTTDEVGLISEDRSKSPV